MERSDRLVDDDPVLLVLAFDPPGLGRVDDQSRLRIDRDEVLVVETRLTEDVDQCLVLEADAGYPSTISCSCIRTRATSGSTVWLSCCSSGVDLTATSSGYPQPSGTTFPSGPKGVGENHMHALAGFCSPMKTSVVCHPSGYAIV